MGADDAKEPVVGRHAPGGAPLEPFRRRGQRFSTIMINGRKSLVLDERAALPGGD